MRVFFYPLFFLLFLLSFFLIEGEDRFYLFALWTIFILCFSRFLNSNKLVDSKQQNQQLSKITALAIIMSLLFFVSFFFSSHLPLSLEKLLFYLVSLAIFVFFLQISNKIIKIKTFLQYLSIVSLILNLFVIFFTFFHPPQSIFPGMNLLVRSYGHNHYVAYLLLVLPVFWWQLLFIKDANEFFSNQESKILTVFLLISSYLIMILSLGRLALVISLLQLLVIFFVNKKLFFYFNSNKKNLAQLISKTLIFIFLFASFIFLILSIPFNQKGKSLCPLIFNQKELCKPFMENDRLSYWQKAWQIALANPLVGSGFKTFNYASRQFLIENYQITSYAHNIFLHNLAETGFLVGGAFILFILYLFHQSFKVMKSDAEPLYQFLWLAAAASLLNAMFDFDWHFFVIFTLTLIFLAIILSDKMACSVKDKIEIASKIQVKTGLTRPLFFKFYFSTLVLLALFFAIACFLSQFWQKYNRPDLIFRFVPFMQKNVAKYERAKKITAIQFEQLYWWYKKDPNFIYDFATAPETPLEKQIELQITLAKIDPPHFIKNVNFGKLDYKQAESLSNEFIITAQKHHFINNVAFLDYWRQQALAKQFFTFANQAYLAENPMLAANYYQKALLFNPYVMGDLRAAFLATENFDQAVIFLKNFKDFNPNDMGKYFYDYMGFYTQTLIYLFEQNRLDDFYVLAQAMFDKPEHYNFSWFLWRDLTRSINNSKAPEDRAKLQKIHEQFKDMTTWKDFWPL